MKCGLLQHEYARENTAHYKTEDLQVVDAVEKWPNSQEANETVSLLHHW